MPRKVIPTLLASIAAHAAVGYALIQPDEQQYVISMGSVKAPISMTFSTVTVPEPQSEPEPTPRPESEKQPEPEPIEKPEPKKDVVVIPDPIVEPEPEPEEESPEEKPPEPAVEELVVRSALEETEVEGLSQEPVFITEPEIRNWVEPRYPRIAQRRNQQGLVMLEVVVDINGQALNIDILESSGFDLLDQSAIAAVQNWEFEPQKRNNSFVQSRVHVPVAFQLN
ncbi:MAG: energy transducer TonB [Endozoicomonas sp.]